MSQLKKGALLSYANIFLTNIIGLILTPFIIRSLGDSEYGLYTLIGAFVGYLSVMDLGLNNTIIRYVSKYRAEKDIKGEQSFLGTTMLIYVFISIAIIVAGIILYYQLDNIFGTSLTLSELDKAKTMFVILIFNLSITLPGGAFTAICNAYEKFVFPRALTFIKYIIRSLLVYIILTQGADSIGLVLLDTIVNLFTIALTFYFSFFKLKARFKFNKFNKELVKEIFSYSIWIFIMAIVMELQWKSGQLILGVKTDTVTVAIYGVGIMLGGYYGAFANAINGLFLPRAMQMIVNNASGKKLTDEMIKIGRITLLVLLLILSGFFLFGKEFVHLWVGDNYKNSWRIALLIMLVSTNVLVQSFANSILRAKKLFKFRGITYIVLTSIGVFLGYNLIDIYGEFGMIIGISIGWFSSQMILNVYFKKKIKLEIGRFYKQLFIKTIIFNLLLIIPFYFLNLNFETYNWTNLIIKISVFVTLYIALIYNFVMNKYEKDLIKNSLKIK